MNTVKRGMTVYASDGKAGRVDDVLYSAETGQPAFLVIDAGGFFSNDVVVPYEQVQRVDDAGVWVALTRAEVKRSPTYDPMRYGSSAGLVSSAAAHFGEE